MWGSVKPHTLNPFPWAQPVTQAGCPQSNFVGKCGNV